MANRIAAVAVTTVVALLAAPVLPVSADSSQLYSRLAPAPGADWVEATSGPTTLEGPFDSHSYDMYLRSVSPKTPSVEKQLDALAFRSGYARMWVQGSSQDLLTERVFQFGDALGAKAWYANLKTQNQFTKYLVKVLPPLDGAVDSFGVVLKTPSFTSYRVEFVVRDLVFTIHVDSTQNDLTAVAVSQALSELTRPVSHPAVAIPAKPQLPWSELVLVGLLLAAAGATAAFVHRRVRRGR